MENQLSLTEQFNNQKANTYCSLNTENVESKKILYKASQKCDYRVADSLNKVIYLKDLYIRKSEKVDESTGEVITKYRTILIDKDGKTYASASKGLFNSVGQLISIMGEPTMWAEPLAIKVSELQLEKGKTYTIELA